MTTAADPFAWIRATALRVMLRQVAPPAPAPRVTKRASYIYLMDIPATPTSSTITRFENLW